MVFSCHILIMITICLSFFLSSLSPTSAVAFAHTATTKKVEEFCSHHVSTKSEDYTFCVEFLGSDPKTTTTTNPVALTKIILQSAARTATTTQGYIRKLIMKTQPSKNATLELCLEAYNGVISEFRSAVRKAEGKHYSMAGYACMDAWDEGNRCEAALASAGVRDSIISAGNNFVRKFSLMGIHLLDHLG